jgi:excisionase family DNA binding protein
MATQFNPSRRLTTRTSNGNSNGIQTANGQSNMLTRDEASTYLRISVRKLDSLVSVGDLPAIRIGSRVLFAREDLDAFIQQQRT